MILQKVQGRLNLNPLTHLDPIAVVLLVFTHIGWGKPVEINPNNFDRKISARAGEAIVAAAGPIMNILLAFVIAIIFYALQVFATGFCNRNANRYDYNDNATICRNCKCGIRSI